MKLLCYLISVLSRGLSKTGQQIQYVAGDDGTYEAGWWIGLLNVGNKVRFVPKTINGDAIVYDRATGLTWAADGDEAGCNNGEQSVWTAAITYANGLDFAGETDWRVPNYMELLSLLYCRGDAPLISGRFPNTKNVMYWTSTTISVDDTMAYVIYFSSGNASGVSKTYPYAYLRCVRGGL